MDRPQHPQRSSRDRTDARGAWSSSICCTTFESALAPTSCSAVVESGTLGWVQICDALLEPPADLIHEARHQRLAPGSGELPLAELLACLDADVTISVEVQNDALLGVPPIDRARLLHRPPIGARRG